MRANMCRYAVVKDAESAATIAFVYISNILGTKHAELDQPYHIQLLICVVV